MFVDLKKKNPKIDIEQTTGFLGGLNTFQDQTVIKNSELTEAKNIILSVDGVEPRYGTERYGDDGSDSKVYGGIGYYQSDGTDAFLRMSGARIKYYNAGAWTQVDTTVFTNAATEFLQVRDEVYIMNGTDNLRKWNGTTMTTYTDIADPTSVTVTPTGTPGTTDYSYIITAANAAGETVGTTQTTTTGAATLNATNYNAIDWADVSGATSYNIYGRTATGFGEGWMATVYESAYNDQGQDTPSTTILPPEEDSTAGIKGTMAAFAISRIFIAGEPTNPSRLYWGGVGTNVGNFSGALEGGGYADVFKNDGSDITAIKAFQGGIIVFKGNGIYKFTFTDEGYPQLDEVTRSFGAVSHRSVQHVENDLIFATEKDGRLAFYSLGIQENYAATVLRTNELSVKVADMMEEVELSLLPNSASFYYRNIYGCAVATESSTTNNRTWCLDTRFGAWVYWEGYTPNSFFTYKGTDGEKLYFGDESSGYVSEMFKTARNDDGVAISTEWATKAFDQKIFHRHKKYFKPTFQFKNITKAGAISGDIVVDGAITEKTFSVSNITSGGMGLGAMLFVQTLFNTATGGSTPDSASADQLVEIYTPALEGRSIKYVFRTNTVDLEFKFLSLAHEYMIMANKPLSQRVRVY